MKTSLLVFVFLLSLLSANAQDAEQKEKIPGLGKFILGDNIDNYAKNLSENRMPDTSHFGKKYGYTGTDVKDIFGFGVKDISLGFCSGSLISAYILLNEPLTIEKMESLKNTITDKFGKPDAHTASETGLNTAYQMNTETWSWSGKGVSLSLSSMRSERNGSLTSLSVSDNNLTMQCMRR